MSIPKEPRQLMINIMYLVLTAMLALNVSAKIINAFFVIDKGIKGTNAVIESSNELVLRGLEASVQQDPAKYGKLLETAGQVQKLSREFNSYVADLLKEMVDASGGMYPDDDAHHPGQPKGYKNKDVTTRLLVTEGKGSELEKRITGARQQLVSMVTALKGLPGTQINDETLANLQKSITLGVSEDWKRDKKSDNWAHFTFNQMPLASIFPLFSKFQNDMKSSEAAVLNYLASQVGATAFKVDDFIPISSAVKSYIIAGEEYQSEITIGASSKSVYENMSVSVNGSSVRVENGIAKFTERPSATGVRKYNVAISITNPTTGERQTYTKEFEYEVGRRSVAVAAEKMNVFYIGVDNPVAVSAAGVSSNELRVSGSGGGIRLRPNGTGKYIATVSEPGTAKISVSGGGLTASTFDFRVKRIPDPQARLSGSAGGPMGSGEFKAQGGVGAFLDNFDFEATCQVVGFNLSYQAKRQDLVEVNNPSARFTDAAQRLIQQAKPGDAYYFDNIRAKCPGDNASRQINSMVFKIR